MSKLSTHVYGHTTSPVRCDIAHRVAVVSQDGACSLRAHTLPLQRHKARDTQRIRKSNAAAKHLYAQKLGYDIYTIELKHYADAEDACNLALYLIVQDASPDKYVYTVSYQASRSAFQICTEDFQCNWRLP